MQTKNLRYVAAIVCLGVLGAFGVAASEAWADCTVGPRSWPSSGTDQQSCSNSGVTGTCSASTPSGQKKVMASWPSGTCTASQGCIVTAWGLISGASVCSRSVTSAGATLDANCPSNTTHWYMQVRPIVE